MPGLLRSDRGGLSLSSPSGERKDACSLRKWCKEDNGGRGGGMQGQQFLVLIEARLSDLSYARVQVNYIIFWPGGLLTF